MFGNIGPTTLTYSNTGTTTIMDLPGVLASSIMPANKVTFLTGPLLTFLGHPPPRQDKDIFGSDLSRAPILDPSTLDSIPENVILSNGRVKKLMQIFEIRGFAFQTGTITFHVRLKSNPFFWNKTNANPF